jgi:hypothetical protein
MRKKPRKNIFYLRKNRILDVVLGYTGLTLDEVRLRRNRKVRNVLIYFFITNGLHKEEIASILGTTTVTVNKTIRQFKDWKNGTFYEFEVFLVEKLREEIRKDISEYSIY